MTRGGKEIDEVERALAREMRAQHGLVRRDQALALGGNRGVIRRRLEAGEWLPAGMGVYRSAAAPNTDHQRLLAAVWAAGEGAIASHRAAAWLWQLLGKSLEVVELTVPGERVARVHGAVVHRGIDVPTMRRVERAGIPVTDPFRTIIDLGAVCHWREVEDVIDRAIATRLVTVDGLLRALDETGRRGLRGAGVLRRLLEMRGVQSTFHAPSVLESRMARLLKPLPLPPPEVELITGARGHYRLDFAWPEVMLAVEVDGIGPHSALHAPDADRLRGNHLQRQGWARLQYTWRHVTTMRAHVRSEIGVTYAARAELRSLGQRPAV